MAATAPRKAAARRTSPAAARQPKLTAVPEPIDIFAEFSTEEKPPVPIRVGKVDADVRRGFTGDEVTRFHALLNANEFEAVFDLITTNGAGIWAEISPLLPDLASKAINKIVKVSEIYEGEATAPLLGYVNNPAGAQPSPESSTTTE
ncbi:hypothetical protein [Nocardia sp. NPDC003963]